MMLIKEWQNSQLFIFRGRMNVLGDFQERNIRPITDFEAPFYVAFDTRDLSNTIYEGPYLLMSLAVTFHGSSHYNMRHQLNNSHP